MSKFQFDRKRKKVFHVTHIGFVKHITDMHGHSTVIKVFSNDYDFTDVESFPQRFSGTVYTGTAEQMARKLKNKDFIENVKFSERDNSFTFKVIGIKTLFQVDFVFNHEDQSNDWVLSANVHYDVFRYLVAKISQ